MQQRRQGIYHSAVRRVLGATCTQAVTLASKHPTVYHIEVIDAPFMKTYVTLTRTDLGTVTATIVMTEAGGSPYDRVRFDIRYIHRWTELLPKSWVFSISVAARAGCEDLIAREGSLQYPISDLLIDEHGHDNIIATLSCLRGRDRPRTIIFDPADYDGQQLNLEQTLQKLKDMRITRIGFDFGEPAGVVRAVETVLKNPELIRAFEDMTLMIDIASLPDRNVIDWLLGSTVENWLRHRLCNPTKPSASKAVTLFVLDSSNRATRKLLDSHTRSRVARFIRLAALLMLAIGGPVAKYEIKYARSGIFGPDTHGVEAKLVEGLYETMLRDEIGRVVAMRGRNFGKGWRKLDKWERRA